MPALFGSSCAWAYMTNTLLPITFTFQGTYSPALTEFWSFTKGLAKPNVEVISLNLLSQTRSRNCVPKSATYSLSDVGLSASP